MDGARGAGLIVVAVAIAFWASSCSSSDSGSGSGTDKTESKAGSTPGTANGTGNGTGPAAAQVALGTLACEHKGSGTAYEVGPDEKMKALGDVPWDKLAADPLPASKTTVPL